MLDFREIKKSDLSSIFVVRVSTRENAYTMMDKGVIGGIRYMIKMNPNCTIEETGKNRNILQVHRNLDGCSR